MGFPTAKEWYVQTSTAYRQGQTEARPVLEADYDAVSAAMANREDTRDEEEQGEESEGEGQDEEVYALSSPSFAAPRVGGRKRQDGLGGTPVSGELPVVSVKHQGTTF